MLDVLRRNAGSWAIKIILGFIAVTFVWWGVGTYTEREREVAATVGGKTISMGQVAEAAAALEKTYRQMYGAGFTPEMAKALDLRRRALDTLVTRTILLEEAERLGQAATDEEVRRDIAEMAPFRTNGGFDLRRYQATLAANRISEAEFEAAKREEITLRKIQGLLAASARVTEPEARDLFETTSRRVRLLLASADPGRFAAVPGEDEVAATYERTKEAYRVPARVKLTVARFDPAFFARSVRPSDEEVRAFYEGNQDRFRTEETRLVPLATLPFGPRDRDAALKRAGDLAAAGSRGREEFEKAAAKLPGGNRTPAAWVTRARLPKEIAEAVFSAPVDQVVGPIEAGGRLLVARVNGIRFPEPRPFGEVRAEAAALLAREKGKDAAVIKVYDAHGKALDAKDLKAACAPHGVVPEATGWLEGKAGEGLPAAVVQEALLLPSGEVGPVKTVGDVHYLFQVAEKAESRLPPLDEVRAKVREAAAREKSRAAAGAAAQKALAGAATAADLERGARGAGLAVASTPFFAPFADPPPGALAPAGEAVRKDLIALTAKKPVLPAVVAAGPQFVAVALLEERPADPKEWESRRTAFMAGLLERKRAQALEAFVAEKRRTAKVEVKPAALK